MKKNNLKQLKEMVNASDLEVIESVKYGVQAYNISANEYEVITKFAKINGRYYFIDRDGNKYLASRYDRAELVARDILDNLRFAEETAYEYVCILEEKKQVAVDSARLPMFFDFCDLFGFDVESVEMHFHNNGEVFTVYRLKSEETAKDDAQSEETAADEQQTENNEQQTENNEQQSESEENAAACEPSMFAGILAKVKSSARKVCEKVALIMALAFVMVVTFAALFGMVYFIPDLLELFGIECGSWAAISLSLLLFCTVIMDACVFVELNTMAAIDYLFPSLFGSAQKPGFTKPFSFWRRVFASDML